MVGTVDTGGVVDGVGVDTPAVAGVLDPGRLGEAEVAALGDHPAAKLDGVDPHGVVGLVAHLRVALPAGLDVGADPAVPQQVHGSPQDRSDQLVRGERGRLQAEELLDRGVIGIDFAVR